MKTSILIPLLNDSALLPKLLRALPSAIAARKDVEILFLDTGSEDGSLALLKAAHIRRASVVEVRRRSFAEALNEGLKLASGERILLLDAGSEPLARWLPEMESALDEADLVVGASIPVCAAKPIPTARVAARLFTKHAERTAHARGYALPWGPAYNLGFRSSLATKTGPFSPEASHAFDIDWCWRAMLQGARMAYAPGAKVKHAIRNERRSILEQFERFGGGEAWLHRTYAFLLSAEEPPPDPLLAGVNAFSRVRHQSEAPEVKALLPVLDEVAAAFSGGVRLGYERPHRACLIPRSIPTSAITWDDGPKTTSVFVPGRGLAVLDGKQRQLFRAMREGINEHELVHLFMKLFKATHQEAEHEVAEFRSSLCP